MSKLQTPSNKDTRKFLLVGGFLSAATGLILIIFGIGYFLLHFFSVLGGGFDPISWQFLCSFVGWPFLFAGVVMCIIGLVSKRNTKSEKPSA
jgi:hypothetical protein